MRASAPVKEDEMKARYLWLVALAAVVGSALLTATAAVSAAAILGGDSAAVGAPDLTIGAGQDPQEPPPGFGPRGGGGPRGPGGLRGRGGLDRMVFELDLTEAQIEQVKVLREAARTASEPYEQQIGKAEEAIRAAIESGSFDEDAVRTLAAGESKAGTELRVLHARTEAAILKVLTAEQREALKNMRPPRPGRGPGM
jgi:Spy/CpxP family protein refolding chaperone